jgi:hypothetical protein
MPVMPVTSVTPGATDQRLLDRSVFVDPATPAERVWAIELALRCAGVAAVIADGTALSMAESRRLQLAATSTNDAPTLPGIQRGTNTDNDATHRGTTHRDVMNRDAPNTRGHTVAPYERGPSYTSQPNAEAPTPEHSGDSVVTRPGAERSSEGGIAWLIRPGHERRTLSAAHTRWLVTPAPSPDHEQAWMLELLRCKGLQPWTGGARRWSVRRDNATGTLGEWETCDVGLAPTVVDRPRPQAGPKIA